MSIDSIGGGNADATRLRKLHEDRSRQVKDAEERSQEELARLLESRENALRMTQESQDRDLRVKQSEMIERTEQAKSLAESRVKSFEADAQRLTEEAKRQFQAKAKNLQRTSKELETQRDQLVKSHESSMEHIKQNAENNRRTAFEQAQLAAAKSHIQQTRRLEEISERGDFEAQRLQDEADDHKRQVANEGRRQVARLEEEQRETAGQIESQTAFAKRAGEAQLIRERENLAKNQERLAMEAEDRMSRQTFENQRVLNRSMNEAKRKLSDADYASRLEFESAQKQARKGMRELQNKAAFNMQQVALEAEAQETIARRAYEQQKALLHEERDKSIVDAQTQNDSLQKQLNADFEARRKRAVEAKTSTFLTQLSQDQAELNFHRLEGNRQINSLVTANAEKVAAHGSKQADPFYRLHALGAQVEDSELALRVSLAVPQHEQDNIRLTVGRDNTITLSGARRHQERAKLEDGHEASTSTYQTFSESFATHGKLDTKNMTRTYSNGRLTFAIPKN